MEDDRAVGVSGLVDLLTRTERGDVERHLVPDADLEVALEADIGAVDDQVGGIGRGRGVGVRLIVAIQLLLYPRQPGFQHDRLTVFLARVERREGADDARLALGDHQVGIGDDEQRRPDGGQAQRIEQGRQGHG